MKPVARLARTQAPRAAALLLALSLALPVAAEIGQIKTSKGQVTVERTGQVLPGAVGLRLEAADWRLMA